MTIMKNSLNKTFKDILVAVKGVGEAGVFSYEDTRRAADFYCNSQRIQWKLQR
jgi:hypothetical protein